MELQQVCVVSFPALLPHVMCAFFCAVVTFRSQPAVLVYVSAVEQLVLELVLGAQDWQHLPRSVTHRVRVRLCSTFYFIVCLFYCFNYSLLSLPTMLLTAAFCCLASGSAMNLSPRPLELVRVLVWSQKSRCVQLPVAVTNMKQSH